MLVAEASARNWRPAPGVWIGAAIISFLFCVMIPLSSLFSDVLVTLCFCFVCFGAIGGDPFIAGPLSCKYLRWFGNMSYSYYLIHGFVVVMCVQGVIKLINPEASNDMFWLFLLPTFAVSLFAGALLFLCIERPYSFRHDFQKRMRIVPETAVHAG
jgi:peptidoglycan/LPS O-acetylase OafA/YrhL